MEERLTGCVGDYRTIYKIDDGKLIIYIVDAGNRGEIYKI